jgi:hypothetical protein
MRIRLLVLATLALVGVACATAAFSGAVFNYAAHDDVTATTDRISNWLHLYSQTSPDPDGDSGYATQDGNPALAASGTDEGITVTFQIANKGTHTHTRVLKVRTPQAFPVVTPAVTSVSVTVTVTPDPLTNQQPINKYGVDAWGAAPTYTKTIANWGANIKRQLNLETKFPGNKFSPGVYTPSVVLTMTYTGLTATYYRYTIPITINYR